MPWLSGWECGRTGAMRCYPSGLGMDEGKSRLRSPCRGTEPVGWEGAAPLLQVSPAAAVLPLAGAFGAPTEALFCFLPQSSSRSHTWASGTSSQGQHPPKRSWPPLSLWTTSSLTWLQAPPQPSSSSAPPSARECWGHRCPKPGPSFSVHCGQYLCQLPCPLGAGNQACAGCREGLR